MTDARDNEYAPTSVSPPGETLEEALQERGMTQSEFAVRTNRPVKTINEIIKGKTAITAATALQFERTLGIPARFWIAREATYQEWRARRSEASQLSGEATWLREIPVRDMVKLGWISAERTAADKVRACLEFFGVASVEAWRAQYTEPLCAFRKSCAVRTQIGAVAAWIRAGEREAGNVSTGPLDLAAFRESLRHLRMHVRAPDACAVVPDLVKTCALNGVAVVFIPSPKGCPASGVAKWLRPEKALILLSLRHKSDDHLWFTFFHEAAHLILHGKRLTFVDVEDRSDDSQEEEANRFSRDLLIPPDAACKLKDLPKTEAAIRAFAEQVGISPGVVVGRMQKERLLPWSRFNNLKVRYHWPIDERSGQVRLSPRRVDSLLDCTKKVE